MIREKYIVYNNGRAIDIRPNVNSQAKKPKLEIAHEIANEVGIHGKSFGRTMREHHKQK